MEQHATIRIPSDHVEAVREHVCYAAQREPKLYGLDAAGLGRPFDKGDLRRLVDRVQPLPITSREIQDAVAR